MVTRQQLLAIMPNARRRVDVYLNHLNEAMVEFNITDPLEVAAFLAQLAHESGELRYVEELASGSDYDTGRLAWRLGNTAEEDGDGQRYKGHGLIQITGRHNHWECADALGIPWPEIVDYLKSPEGATRSAAWYWERHRCGEPARAGDFREVTKIINGGYRGYQMREMYYERAKLALGVENIA